MKASEFLTMILAGLLAVCLAPCCNAQTKPDNYPIKVERDGHCLQVEFRSEIVTNPAPPAGIVWTNICTTNYGFYYYSYPPHEDPFPRSSESSEYFEVVSNTYALFVLDNGTNRVAQNSVKLGTITRKSKTVITANTNTINTETFEAAN